MPLVERLKPIIRIVLATAFVLTAARGEAVPIVYSGFDPGANSSDPRPISAAAATAFDAAAGVLGGMSLITFESAPVGAFNDLTVAPGVTIDGTDQLGADQTIRDTAFFIPDGVFGYNTTTGGSQYLFRFGGDLVFTFATPINAFGAYFAGLEIPNTLEFDDGNPQIVPLPFEPSGSGFSGGGVAFVGFTNATPFSTLRVPYTSDLISVDDVRFGPNAASTVPDEPATVILLGLGIAGLAVAAAKRRPAAR